MPPKVLQMFKVKRSRSQRGITCAKVRQIINNSPRDSPISLKCRADFDHVTLDVSRTFNFQDQRVKGQGQSVT